MAIVKGPLMSFDARGQFGKSLVYLGWNGIKTVRAHAVPSNPRSVAQVAQRHKIAAAVAFYKSIPFTAVDLEALQFRAQHRKRKLQGYNYFIWSYLDTNTPTTHHGSNYGFQVSLNSGGVLHFSSYFVGTITPLFNWSYRDRPTGPQVYLTRVGMTNQFTGSLTGLEVGSFVTIFFHLGMTNGNFSTGFYRIKIL